MLTALSWKLNLDTLSWLVAAVNTQLLSYKETHAVRADVCKHRLFGCWFQAPCESQSRSHMDSIAQDHAPARRPPVGIYVQWLPVASTCLWKWRPCLYKGGSSARWCWGWVSLAQWELPGRGGGLVLTTMRAAATVNTQRTGVLRLCPSFAIAIARASLPTGQPGPRTLRC